MKKVLALVLCLITAMSLLAACGGSNVQETTPPTDASGKEIPVVTIGIPENPSVNYTNNTYTQLIERIAGVKIEYVFFQMDSADYLSQLSLRVAGQEKLPDIIWGFNGMSADVRSSYGQQGVFIDITDYLMDEEMSATWWERFNQLDPGVQSTVLADMKDVTTGETYGFPSILDPGEDVCSFFPMINQKWLDALNLPMPTDIKMLEDTLRAFKNQDPNGDGKKNEVPCMAQKGGTGARGLDYFVNLYTYLDTTTGYLELDGNGNVVCTATSEKYREALKWVYDMVQEGLIYKNSPDTGSADINALLITEGVDRVGMIVCHPLIAMGTSSTNKQFVPLPVMNYSPLLQGQHLYCTFITESCENIEAAWSVLMAMSTREAQLHQTLGVYGVHFTEADPGTKAVWGGEAMYKNTDTKETLPTQNRWLLHGAGIMQPYNLQMPDLDYDNIDSLTVAQYKNYVLVPAVVDMYRANAAEKNPDEKYICPKLVPTADDLQDCPTWSIMPDEFKRWRAMFMGGQKNPHNEADWAEYLSALNSSGFESYMETAQAIYDREHKGK